MLCLEEKKMTTNNYRQRVFVEIEPKIKFFCNTNQEIKGL